MSHRHRDTYLDHSDYKDNDMDNSMIRQHEIKAQQPPQQPINQAHPITHSQGHDGDLNPTSQEQSPPIVQDDPHPHIHHIDVTSDDKQHQKPTPETAINPSTREYLKTHVPKHHINERYSDITHEESKYNEHDELHDTRRLQPKQHILPQQQKRRDKQDTAPSISEERPYNHLSELAPVPFGLTGQRSLIGAPFTSLCDLVHPPDGMIVQYYCCPAFAKRLTTPEGLGHIFLSGTQPKYHRTLNYKIRNQVLFFNRKNLRHVVFDLSKASDYEKIHSIYKNQWLKRTYPIVLASNLQFESSYRAIGVKLPPTPVSGDMSPETDQDTQISEYFEPHEQFAIAFQALEHAWGRHDYRLGLIHLHFRSPTLLDKPLVPLCEQLQLGRKYLHKVDKAHISDSSPYLQWTMDETLSALFLAAPLYPEYHHNKEHVDVEDDDDDNSSLTISTTTTITAPTTSTNQTNPTVSHQNRTEFANIVPTTISFPNASIQGKSQKIDRSFKQALSPLHTFLVRTRMKQMRLLSEYKSKVIRDTVYNKWLALNNRFALKCFGDIQFVNPLDARMRDPNQFKTDICNVKLKSLNFNDILISHPITRCIDAFYQNCGGDAVFYGGLFDHIMNHSFGSSKTNTKTDSKQRRGSFFSRLFGTNMPILDTSSYMYHYTPINPPCRSDEQDNCGVLGRQMSYLLALFRDHNAKHTIPLLHHIPSDPRLNPHKWCREIQRAAECLVPLPAHVRAMNKFIQETLPCRRLQRQLAADHIRRSYTICSWDDQSVREDLNRKSIFLSNRTITESTLQSTKKQLEKVYSDHECNIYDGYDIPRGGVWSIQAVQQHSSFFNRLMGVPSH